MMKQKKWVLIGTMAIASLIAQGQQQSKPFDIKESLSLDNQILYCPSSGENLTKALIKRFTDSSITYSVLHSSSTDSLSHHHVIAIGASTDAFVKKCLALTPLRLSKDTLTVNTCFYAGDDIRLIFHIPNPFDANKNILIYTAQEEQNLPEIIGYAEKIKDWDFVAYRRIEGDRQPESMIVAGKFKEVKGVLAIDSFKVWRKDPEKYCIIKKELISYVFPENSYALSIYDSLISQCEQTMHKSLAIIGEEKYTGAMQIQFVRSREEIKKYMGAPVSGQADPLLRIVYIKCEQGDHGPIVHELMHMISCNAWGFPGTKSSSTWMNEGLAIYADNDECEYTVDQIYAFLSEKKMLIPMDTLVTNFYKQREMIAYYQSGYIIQYLIKKYGIKRLKELWQSGFKDFERIYGVPYRKVESDLQDELRKRIPIAPHIVWKF